MFYSIKKSTRLIHVTGIELLRLILIIIKNLTKKFDKIIAADHVSLDIHEGEVFGLLGPNGAGKTTIIHMLATLLKPTSGTAEINGYDIVKDSSKVRKNIGIVFQAPSSDDMLTGFENLKIHSYLYGVPSELRINRITELLKLVGLYERKDDIVKKYSGGMRRRLEIARGLIHKPKVMFLDEPTLGLDPNSRKSMWNYIQKLVKEEKITIILTTHYMEEADMLCDRIGFINRGKISAIDTPKQLKLRIKYNTNNNSSKYIGDIIKLYFKSTNNNTNNHNNNIETLTKNIKILKSFEFVKKIEQKQIVEDKKILLILHVDNINYNLPIVLKSIDNVESVEFSQPTLDDVFQTFTKGTINEEPEGGFMERYAQYDRQ
ncbi:MAG TPA: ATP-binding cassette domain-containing protein [Nitrososphaeraceae archaeon]|nr:ATP-binding cassette domain-containing protein [Nitrososphaeraceae archaeon]